MCSFNTSNTFNVMGGGGGLLIFCVCQIVAEMGPMQLAITWLDRAMIESKLGSVDE